jgi:hypothetical protein
MACAKPFRTWHPSNERLGIRLRKSGIGPISPNWLMDEDAAISRQRLPGPMTVCLGQIASSSSLNVRSPAGSGSLRPGLAVAVGRQKRSLRAFRLRCCGRCAPLRPSPRPPASRIAFFFWPRRGGISATTTDAPSAAVRAAPAPPVPAPTTETTATLPTSLAIGPPGGLRPPAWGPERTLLSLFPSSRLRPGNRATGRVDPPVGDVLRSDELLVTEHPTEGLHG